MSLNTDGGITVNYLDSSVFLVVFIYNLTDQIIKNQNIMERWSYTIPFLIMSILIFFLGNKYVRCITYYLLAVSVLFTAEYYSDFSSSIFFIYSFHVIKKKSVLILNLTSTVVFLSIRYTIYDKSIMSIVLMMIIFAYIYSIYYFLIFKHKKKRVDIWDKVSQKDRDILKLFMQGDDFAEISTKLKIDDKKESIRAAITRCRRLSNCNNDMEFAIWLTEIG